MHEPSVQREVELSFITSKSIYSLQNILQQSMLGISTLQAVFTLRQKQSVTYLCSVSMGITCGVLHWPMRLVVQIFCTVAPCKTVSVH